MDELIVAPFLRKERGFLLRENDRITEENWQ